MKESTIDPSFVRMLIEKRETAHHLNLTPAIAWVRVSTTKKEQEKSFEDQPKDARAFAKLHGLYLCHVWETKESGSVEEQRKEFRKLVKVLSTKSIGIKHVVTKDRSRIRRGDYGQYEKSRLIKEYGVTFHYYAGGTKDSPDSTADSKILDRADMLTSAYLADKLSDEMKRAYARKKENGIPPSARSPLGYKFNSKDQKREIDPLFENTVTRLLDEFDTGRYSIAEFVRWANDAGLKGKRGADWHKGSMEKFLKRPDYHGESIFKGEILKGHYPTYVSKERYEERLRRMGAGRNGDPEPREHVLRKYVICSECKRLYTPELRHGEHKSGVYVYYHHECKVAGSSTRVRQEQLMSALDSLIEGVKFRLRFSDRLKSLFKQDLAETDALAKSLRAKASALISINEARSKKNYLAFLDGVIDKEEYAAHDRGFKAAIRAATADFERASINREKVLAEIFSATDLLKEFPTIYAKASNEDKLRIVRECTSGMVYNRKAQSYKLSWLEPFSYLMEEESMGFEAEQDGFRFVLKYAQERT